jgi:hypothetical protein
MNTDLSIIQRVSCNNAWPPLYLSVGSYVSQRSCPAAKNVHPVESTTALIHQGRQTGQHTIWINLIEHSIQWDSSDVHYP